MSFGNDSADKMIWVQFENGKFSVQFLYKAMMCKNYNHFTWKGIQRIKVPLKVGQLILGKF